MFSPNCHSDEVTNYDSTLQHYITNKTPDSVIEFIMKKISYLFFDGTQLAYRMVIADTQTYCPAYGSGTLTTYFII